MSEDFKSEEQDFYSEFESHVKSGTIPEEFVKMWTTWANESKESSPEAFQHFLEKHKRDFSKYLPKFPVKKVRHSGHFVDQKLHYTQSPNIFSFLEELKSEGLKSMINNKEIEVKAVGIRLTPAEDKLLIALQKLLYEKSPKVPPKDGQFYKGNEKAAIVSFGDKKELESPAICIKPSELYKAFLGKTNYSSHEMKHIRETLSLLASKKFLMIYKRKRTENVKGTQEAVYDIIEVYQSLIDVIKFTEGVQKDELSLEGEEEYHLQEKKGAVIIGFNPILVDQINSKYVEYPSDINQKMAIAAGGARFVTEAMNLLRDYMLRSMSAKQFTVEIEEGKLVYTLKLDNYLRRRQKALALQRIESAIDVLKKVKILNEHAVTTTKHGLPKYIFQLNSSFNKD